MAYIILPRKWTQQPQYPVEINDGHPLAAKVAYASTLAGSAYDSVSGKINLESNTARMVGINGGATRFNGSNSYVALPTTNLVSGYPLTVSCWFEKTTATSQIIYSLNGSNYSAIAGYYSGTALELTVNTGSSNNSLGYDFLPNPSGWNHLAVVHRNGNFSMYINGIDVANALRYMGTWGQPAAGNHHIGGRVNGASVLPFNGGISDFLVFDGELSPSEISEVYSNPWQIFKRRSRRVWVAAAGGGDVTIAAAASSQATASANLTTAIPITAAALGIGTATASLSTAIPLSGVAASVASGSGALTAQVRLSADALAQAVSAAALSSGIILTAAAVAQAAAAGTLSSAIQLIANAAAQASAPASLTAGSSGLAANAQASASASAALTIQIQLSAAALAQATASASLTAAGLGLSATAIASASAQGDITTQIKLNAAALAEAIAVGGLTARIDLGANAITTADASAWLLTAVQLAADASVISTAEAALTGGSLSVVRYQALSVDVFPVELTADVFPIILTADVF